ncbi:MAG: SDR family oxidoreductase [Candidatus Omnitrophica bacterium]|nr:SDR family oxidoreductase [Candidatus Omnitrophota bacterium]
MSLYLVTGGAGFIGSNIVEELLKRGESVRVLDNFITGSKENLEFVSNYKQSAVSYELIEGDIRSKDDLKKALKDVDYVLHQAALRSVAKSVENPLMVNDVNVGGTLNLLEEAKKAGIRRLVYASSSSCYGDVEKFPQREDFNPRPISPYGVSKLAGENYCHTFSATFGLETVSLRYFNVFGLRQNPESKYSAAIPALLSRMLNNKAPIVEWDGKQSRDFTYVYNVVEANIKSATTDNISGEVFNVACGNSVSILDIVDMLNEILGKKLKPELAPKRAGDVRKSFADITKMKKMLKLKSVVSFEEGLRRTTGWFQENKEKLLAI